jgi:uncharacterized protein (DUF1800 family)
VRPAPHTTREKVAHLLRRAGFGATPEELERYAQMGYRNAVEHLVHFEEAPDDVDRRIGRSGAVAVLPPDQVARYAPNYQIQHARARWLFRMLYTRRPLQEKMALFWHNHFATGWSKIAAEIGHHEATRLMAAVPDEDPAGQVGQVELFRRMALASFGDLLLAVATDPAMLCFLDGRRNVKALPQESFGREVMEQFTLGLSSSGAATFTEEDVQAAARVFTGWNLQREWVGEIRIGDDTHRVARYSFYYDTRHHDTEAKPFTFPIYPGGMTANVIPARPAEQGAHDGMEFLGALLRHPATAHRLATKLYQFFVSDTFDPPQAEVAAIAGWLRDSRFDMRRVMSRIFLSDFFLADAAFGARYRWPVEHMVGMMKAVGPGTRPLSWQLQTLSQMGQELYDPPSVAGYPAGPTWINSHAMLARSNFGSTLGRDIRDPLAQELAALSFDTPEALVEHLLLRMGVGADDGLRAHLARYAQAGLPAAWSGSYEQLRLKLPGLIHLISGAGHFAFV